MLIQEVPPLCGVCDLYADGFSLHADGCLISACCDGNHRCAPKDNITEECNKNLTLIQGKDRIVPPWDRKIGLTGDDMINKKSPSTFVVPPNGKKKHYQGQSFHEGFKRKSRSLSSVSRLLSN